MPSPHRIQDYLRENRVFQDRLIWSFLFVIICLAAIIARLFYLQVSDYQHFDGLAENNRITVKALAPQRGLIYDRNGIVLAQNKPSFSLEITPEDVVDIDATLIALQSIISRFGERELKRAKKAIKKNFSYKRIPLLFHLTAEDIAIFSVNQHRFHGVAVRSVSIRDYPQGELAAHVLGYVGRMSVRDLKQVDSLNYKGTVYVGKSGLEKAFEAVMHGTVGEEKYETNVTGRPIRTLETIRPMSGDAIYTTLDSDVQRVAQKALGGERGAVVAIKPATGEIIAMVSAPGYDPNLFVTGIDHKTYQKLMQPKVRALFNRAISGQYPPGSTIKPLMGLAGLEKNKTTATHITYCPGWYQLGKHEHKYRDWKHRGHGKTTLEKAIIESCDVFFYDLAVAMGIDGFSEYLSQFGLGSKTGIEISGEAKGLMPTRAWKKATHNKPWYPGETVIAGIGQGFMLTTPLQLAVSTAVIASRGQLFHPTLFYARENSVTHVRQGFVPEKIRQISLENVEHWDTIINAMKKVVSSRHGTARKVRKFAHHRMAGKTGTAQVFSLGGEKYTAKALHKSLRDHSLFIGFSPPEKPQIAIAVIVENDGANHSAAPIAQKVVDSYLDKYAPPTS